MAPPACLYFFNVQSISIWKSIRRPGLAVELWKRNRQIIIIFCIYCFILYIALYSVGLESFSFQITPLARIFILVCLRNKSTVLEYESSSNSPFVSVSKSSSQHRTWKWKELRKRSSKSTRSTWGWASWTPRCCTPRALETSRHMESPSSWSRYGLTCNINVTSRGSLLNN